MFLSVCLSICVLFSLVHISLRLHFHSNLRWRTVTRRLGTSTPCSRLLHYYTSLSLSLSPCSRYHSLHFIISITVFMVIKLYYQYHCLHCRLCFEAVGSHDMNSIHGYTLDCDQSNVYSLRVIFSTVSQDLPFHSFSLYRKLASDPPLWKNFWISVIID